MKIKVIRAFASGNIIYDPGCVIDPSKTLAESFVTRGWCVPVEDDVEDRSVEVATAPEPEMPTRRKRGRPRKVPVEILEVS